VKAERHDITKLISVTHMELMDLVVGQTDQEGVEQG
jgi:hypothetical protein